MDMLISEFIFGNHLRKMFGKRISGAKKPPLGGTLLLRIALIITILFSWCRGGT
jgi:hypothetical protein